MPEQKPVTLAEIARQAGVSVMTVSRALRNHSNLKPETRTRIQQIARQLDYRPNPLISALMSYRRAARPLRHHTTLAFITSFATRDGWKESPINHDFFLGAAARAELHGYQLEVFWLREPKMTPMRLSRVLYHRKVPGVLVAPLPVAKGHLRLEWQHFAAVALGYSLARPTLHRAANHQFRSISLAVRRIRRYGYRKLGLALRASIDERVDHQWMGGFLVEQRRFPTDDHIPVFLRPDREWTRKELEQWYFRYKPQVIISQHEEIIDWLRKAGVKVPEQAGFVHLNCPKLNGEFAGIYQHGQSVGGMAVDFLVGMIHRNERGVPPLAHSLLEEGSWQDGWTLLKNINQV